MNTNTDFPSDTCKGRCVTEMLKQVDPLVVEEFLEVVRDFHNDVKTARKLKNMIMSESCELIRLLNARVNEMILMVEEVFLNRRQRQTSFYRLCHELARKSGSDLPHESKCVCFSEENLRRFSINPGVNPCLEFSSNLSSMKKAMQEYFGVLRCTECGQQPGSTLSSVPDCSCSIPSASSQYKVHEALLKFSKCKDDMLLLESSFQDSLYLSQINRDFAYYRSRQALQKYNEKCPPSSDESVDSFEVISTPNHRTNSEDFMDADSFGSDFSYQTKMFIDLSKLLDEAESVSAKNEINQPDSIQLLSQNLNHKLRQRYSSRQLAEDGSSFISMSNVKSREVKKDSSPATLLMKSFDPYFSKCNKSQYIRPNTCKPVDLVNKAINPIKKRGSSPTDSLKSSFNSYFKKEMTENWLRN